MTKKRKKGLLFVYFEYTSIYQKAIFLFLLLVVAFDAYGQKRSTQIKNNPEFISYPEFPEAHSTWGDIGYNPVYNKVYIGVTNHLNKVGLYEYDIARNEMKLNGFIADMANLRPFQWQGKIHSKIVFDKEGTVYFSTDGGDYRHLYFMDGPLGYVGGYFMKWNPADNKLTNLGMGLQYESTKDLDIDMETGNLYGTTFPQVHFLIYDANKNDLKDLGRLGSGHVPRVLFTDTWGNCYYVDWRQRLVKYEKSEEKLIFAKESLPSFPGTPGYSIITGITAYAKDTANNIVYLITYGGKILAYHPQKTGFGKVEDLGGVYDAKGKEKWNYYVPNLAMGKNGKLYYFVGGHGIEAVKNSTLFIEFDPKTRERKVLIQYPTSVVHEATGADVIDEDGNIYFAGRKGDNHNSTPFMIKFNPARDLKY